MHAWACTDVPTLVGTNYLQTKYNHLLDLVYYIKEAIELRLRIENSHYLKNSGHVTGNGVSSLNLQVLYFLDPVRAAMQSHLCAKEFCLTCELGFLFRMLDRSDGRSCQASNFLRAFRTLREASGLGLLLNWGDEQLSRKMDLSKLIQSWTRFVLQQVSRVSCNPHY